MKILKKFADYNVVPTPEPVTDGFGLFDMFARSNRKKKNKWNKWRKTTPRGINRDHLIEIDEDHPLRMDGRSGDNTTCPETDPLDLYVSKNDCLTERGSFVGVYSEIAAEEFPTSFELSTTDDAGSFGFNQGVFVKMDQADWCTNVDDGRPSYKSLEGDFFIWPNSMEGTMSNYIILFIKQIVGIGI